MNKTKRENSSVVELNRGGQTLIHFIRMLKQTLRRYFKTVFTVYALITASSAYLITSSLDFYMGFKYYLCKFQVDFLNLKQSAANLTLPDGRAVRVTNMEIVSSPLMQRHADALRESIVLGAWIAAAISLLVAYLLYRYLVQRGKTEAQDDHIRGAELVDTEKLILLAAQKVAESKLESRISFGPIPLQRWQENSGFLLSGAPGVGKSTAFRDLLRQLRKQNRKAVIYDISGEFVKRFYRPGIDIILNPFDARSHSWDVWSEGRNEMDYDRHAKAAIPDSHDGDPFWTLAAQLVFSGILQRLGENHEKPQMEHLMTILLRMSADQIANVVANTDARTVINVDADKLAQSVRAIIVAYTRNLKYFSKCSGPRFSFKEWARNDEDRSWVFITVRDDMKAALKSPMTMLIEAALSAILSIEPDDNRLIGVAIDEIKTLNPIPSIPDFAATARKFGGMMMVGLQSPSQMDQLYGSDGAKALFDIMGTFAAFRINGKDGAKWSAAQLGDREIESASENTSFGANDVRDAVSVSHSLKESDLLLASEITELPDLTCYLRLGRGLPVTKVHLPHDGMKKVAEGIVEADFLSLTESQKRFSIENKVAPEAVLASIYEDAEINNISDVRSWDGKKRASENNSGQSSNTSSGEGIGDGVDLMAIASSREHDSPPNNPSGSGKDKDKGLEKSLELDAGI